MHRGGVRAPADIDKRSASARAHRLACGPGRTSRRRPGRRRERHRDLQLGVVAAAGALIGFGPAMVEHVFAARMGFHVAGHGADNRASASPRVDAAAASRRGPDRAGPFQRGQEIMRDEWIVLTELKWPCRQLRLRASAPEHSTAALATNTCRCQRAAGLAHASQASAATSPIELASRSVSSAEAMDVGCERAAAVAHYLMDNCPEAHLVARRDRHQPHHSPVRWVPCSRLGHRVVKPSRKRRQPRLRRPPAAPPRRP